MAKAMLVSDAVTRDNRRVCHHAVVTANRWRADRQVTSMTTTSSARSAFDNIISSGSYGPQAACGKGSLSVAEAGELPWRLDNKVR